MKIYLSCLLALIVNVSLFIPAYAFDEVETHPKITNKAITQSNLKPYLIANVGMMEGENTILKDENGTSLTITSWFQQGSTDEDALTACRASNHFHNPVHSGDWTQSQMSDSLFVDNICGTSRYSNVTWGTGFTYPAQGPVARTGQEMGWDNARTYFHEALTSTVPAVREEKYVKTFKAVGQVMHLLQDMAVPAHVRNDMSSHLTNRTQWGKNPFELYVVSHTAGIGADPVPPQFAVPFRVTDFWDTNSYTGNNPSTNPSSGTNRGLAEYVNANYVSDNTIFASDTKHYFQYPSETTSVQEITRQIQDRFDTSKTIPRKYYWKTGDGDSGYLLAGVGYLIVRSPTPRPPYVLFPMDDYVHADYATRLLPRAVGYSASLLDYFFRGKIDISVPANGLYSMISGTATQFTSIKLRAKNGSAAGEEMTDGDIKLVVKYKVAQEDPFKSGPVPTTPDFSYIVAPEKDNVRTISRSYTEFNFDLNLPHYATDISLQVVYKGRLGNEDGAVAAGFKDISEPTPIDMFNNMDKVCISGSWYNAGSTEAIAQVDANHDGIAGLDEADVYAHGIENIYFRISPYSQSPPYYYASPTEYDFTVSSLNIGNHVRAVYVLSDYMFNKGYYLTFVNLNPSDPYNYSDWNKLWWHSAVKRQKDYSMDSVLCGGAPPCYVDVYPGHSDVYPLVYSPVFYTFRGSSMWFGSVKVMINNPYPINSQCSYDLL
jgi:hypothetical protein